MKLLMVTVLLFLFSLANANVAREYSSLVDPFQSLQNPCDNIRNGQFICKDCATLAFCMQENDNWHSVDIASCDTSRNMYCDEESRACAFKSACVNIRGPKFECQNEGIFPDPYDCKQYHICNAANIDTRFICPLGKAYSPATKSCSLSSNDDICYKKQYNCEKVYDMGAWPSDANIYYMCWYTTMDGQFVTYPLLQRCPDGYIFKPNGCVPGTLTAPTLSPPGTQEGSLIDNHGGSLDSQACDLGSGIKANGNDCYSYYMCKNGQLESKKCPDGTHFDAKSHSCQLGGC